ncbi:TIGR00266 family protein [Stetteria hydrogenophila]
MKWLVDHRPAYSTLKVQLEPGEEVTAEAGAFMLGRGRVSVKTSTGGILKGLLRRFMGGESLWLNTYRAEGGPAEVWLVPPLPGDIEALNLTGDSWVIQDSSYLAHYGHVDLSVAWRGFKGLLAEGELVWLKASGHGTVWVNAYGGIERVKVPAGERVVIDNFHFVAMPEGVKYRITKIGGLKTMILGGEGVGVEVWGPAEVLVQTRTLPELVRLLLRYLPHRR